MRQIFEFAAVEPLPITYRAGIDMNLWILQACNSNQISGAATARAFAFLFVLTFVIIYLILKRFDGTGIENFVKLTNIEPDTGTLFTLINFDFTYRDSL